MLLELYIENFALIDKLRLRLEAGLNILSGETGAGKSIVIDAVETVLGGRASADYVRTGAERAVVEAVFDVSRLPAAKARLGELGFEPEGDGTLVLSREISRSGRHSGRINGRPATASMIREVTSHLIDLHGQHEHQSLLGPENHLELVDQFGGPDVLKLRDEVAATHRRLNQVQRELDGLGGNERERQRRLDLLRFQMEELDSARLTPGEEEDLNSERRILGNAERLFGAAGRVYALLYEGEGRGPAALDLVGQAGAELKEAIRFDPALAGLGEMLDSARYTLEEVAREASRYRDRVEFNPARLAQVEERLDLLSKLKRKYGETVAEMIRYRDEVAAELDRLAKSDEVAAALRAEKDALSESLASLARSLSRVRNDAGRELSRLVEAELGGLGMDKARFEAGLQLQLDAQGRPACGPRGADRVEFLLSPNPGEPLKPLARIASGGELSRIMLALKVVLSRLDAVPTLIFDEVDAGIGGRAAQAVAERMAYIAGARQVICVTHLPQIAAMADCHFLIQKRAEENRTRTSVAALDLEGRAAEIARMLGGAEITDLTLRHALEMIEQARLAAAAARGA